MSLGIETALLSENQHAFQLANISLPAKAFVPATQTEIDCLVTELSPDGAYITTPRASLFGAEIALYIESFDRFSASVVCTRSDGVRVKFNCSPNKRARIAEKISYHLNGQPVPLTSLLRVQGPDLRSVRNFTRQKNGETASFEVIDISLSGASLRTSCRPAIDEIVTIGSVEGRVTRHFDDGIAVEFARRTASKFSAAR